jgi:N-acetylglutamate synthase-like GNAT family acetyltransferase
MYSFTTAESWSPAGLWSWFVAGRETCAALDAVAEAAGSLSQLAVDADWQAQGVRALHALLVELQSRAEAVMAELHVREWEISRTGAS